MTFTEHTPIPHIDTVTEPFHGTEQLRQRWRALMGPLGFSERLLWFVFVDDDCRIIPAANKLDLPATPDARLADLLMNRLGEIATVDGSVSVACLLTRPGVDGISTSDEGWAHMLAEAGARHRVSLHPIHRANDATLVTMPKTISEVA